MSAPITMSQFMSVCSCLRMADVSEASEDIQSRVLQLIQRLDDVNVSATTMLIIEHRERASWIILQGSLTLLIHLSRTSVLTSVKNSIELSEVRVGSVVALF